MGKSIKTLFAVWVLLFANSTISVAQKSILKTHSAVYVGGEILDPFFNLYESMKIVSRVNLGAETKVGLRNGIGIKYMHSKFKTYPWSWGQQEEPYTRLGQYDSVVPLKRIGHTINNGMEVYFKHFRKKRDAIYPAGRYVEFGIGIFNTRFTGYHYTVETYQNGNYGFAEVNEPVRSVRTVAFSYKIGKQWIFENNMFLNYGLSFRLHLPLSFVDVDLAYMEDNVRTLYYNDVLSTDWLSSYFQIGYLF
ncbi:MAG: hypothetical protein GC181_12900 [Bacteroidetes bacterium]|nr:hypothetical protein [Bacteroidota bacterium]